MVETSGGASPGQSNSSTLTGNMSNRNPFFVWHPLFFVFSRGNRRETIKTVGRARTQGPQGSPGWENPLGNHPSRELAAQQWRGHRAAVFFLFFFSCVVGAMTLLGGSRSPRKVSQPVRGSEHGPPARSVWPLARSLRDRSIDRSVERPAPSPRDR